MNLLEILYKVWGHTIILKSFGNNKYCFETPKIDLFVKFYENLGYSIIIESFG